VFLDSKTRWRQKGRVVLAAALLLVGWMTALSQAAKAPSKKAQSRDGSATKAADKARTEATTATAVLSEANKLSFDQIRNRIPSTTETVPLARIDAATVTNGVLRAWLETPGVIVFRPKTSEQLTAAQAMALSGAELADVIFSLGLYEMAREESLHDADFVSTGLASAILDQQHQIIRQRFLETKVNEKNPAMTEEEARRWYQENIGVNTLPFNFSVRTIFLSTYRPYAVRKGETPEKVAAEVSGDPKAASRILDSFTSHPFYRPFDLMRVLPPLPVRVGEIVWVPMNDKERQAVRQRMEKIEAELRSGADFETLAKTHSDDVKELRGARIGPLPTPGRPLLESVLNAAVQTPVGKVTPILDTPNGFLLLQILDKTERSVRPFEEVRSQLISDELQARRARVANELLQKLVYDPIVKIDREALMADKAPDNRVIASVGTFQYTWGDYRRDTGRRYSAPPTYEARVQLMESSNWLREHIIAAKAVEMGLDRDPAVARRLRAVETVLRGQAYVEWYTNHRVRVTEEHLRQFYLKERDQFRQPGRFKLLELIMKLAPEETSDTKKIETLMTFLRDDLAPQAKTERAFARLAASESNWPAAKRERGAVKDADTNYRGPEFAKTIETLEPGRCYGPYHVGDEVFLVWIRDRSPVRYRTFDEVRSPVEQLYRRQHWGELVDIAQKDIRARHRLELLFTLAKEGGAESAGSARSTRSP
jgi:parvulin-like peptidyl-prolyl isomerase